MPDLAGLLRPGIAAKGGSRADVALAIASGALLTTIFLPWYGVDVLGRRVDESPGVAFAPLWWVGLCALGSVAILALRLASGRMPAMAPKSVQPLLAGLAALNLGLVVLAFFTNPTEIPAAAVAAAEVTYVRSPWALAGLAAALAATVAACWPRREHVG